MSSRFRKLQARGPRQCIFCDNAVGSKEHLWSTWMHELLPEIANHRHRREIIAESPFTGRNRSGPGERPGQVHSIRVRAVCVPCNSGWMNRLEGEARPLLTPLIAGIPVALDAEQTTIVAQWVALKCMVAEHTDEKSIVTPRRDRERFRQTRNIPDYMSIYVASHGAQVGSSLYRHSLCFSNKPPPLNPPLDGVPKNIQTVTFLLGRVFVHAIAARIADFKLEDRVHIPRLYETSRIWPPDHFEMVWPREPIFTTRQIDEIAGGLAAYLDASNLTWLNYRPE